MRNQILKGFKCKVIRSNWLLYCGAFSHEKHIRIPEIEITQAVSAAECENMVNTNNFISHYGTTHGVAMNEETVFSVNEMGMTHTESNGKIWCQGQQMKIDDTVINDVLMMSQYRVVLEKEEYLITSTQAQTLHKVEATFDHVKLPRACTAEASGCVTNDWTYIWNPLPIACKLMKIREGNFLEENGHLVDHELKLIFKVTGENGGLPGCPPGKLYYTEQRGVTLTKGSDYKWIDRQLDFTIYSDQKDDYITFMMEKMTGKLENTIDQKLCNSKYAWDEDKIIQMNEDRFAKRKGDILYTFRCPEKKGKIAPMKNACMNKIPLETGNYVDPVSRIATAHASQQDCNTHFPLTVKSEDGWVTISDTVQPAVAPQEIKMLNENFKHEEMSVGGIYRPDALSQFENIIEYGSFHEAVIETLGYGICRKENGPCTPIGHETIWGNAPVYNLQKLTEEIQSEFNLFSSFDTWITKNGGYLALIVIAGWTIQLLIAAGMVIMTALKDGLAAAMAAIYAVCCFLPHQVNKVRRQAARKRASAPPEELLPMYPTVKPL